MKSSARYLSIVFALQFFITGCEIKLAETTQLHLPGIFSDQMVLQRDRDVRVWGHAGPGEEVEVTIGEITTTATTDEQGEWLAILPAFEAGGPYEMSVSADTIFTYSDVMFGDVWVASGQSNMEWKLSWGINNQEIEIAQADYPDMRFFDVPNVVSAEPRSDVSTGSWLICNPTVAGDFSAVAYFFARHIHEQIDVPVGIIDATWGGTPAEAWTSSEVLLTLPEYRGQMEEILNTGTDWEQLFEENERNSTLKQQLIEDVEQAMSYGVYTVDCDDSDWDVVSLPNTEPITDFVWFRKDIELPAGPTDGYNLVLGQINQAATFFLNGERFFHKANVDVLEVVPLPADLVKPGQNLLVLRAMNNWNNNVTIGKEGAMYIFNDSNRFRLNLEGEWRYNNTIEPEMPEVQFFSWTPSFLYNGMIAPIEGYPITGAIWYQGESNAGEAPAYHSLFSAMIQDWRTRWGQGDFPFLFVQLAAYMQKRDEPGESNWAALREAQLETLDLPTTGMAVTIDIGDAEDIHPRNKQDVGKRLGLAARKIAYDQDLIHSGPIHRDYEVAGHEMVLFFDHVGSGLTVPAGQPLSDFTIAGMDREFQWAEARIEEDRVIVWSDRVYNPVAVRYAWADNPTCNLYNREDLPASPFRTDDWK